MAEHTPTPWFLGPTPGYLGGTQYKDDGARHSDPITIRSPAHTEEIATVWTYLLPTEANAEFIVRACNSHDEVLAALERLLEHTGGCDFHDNANDEMSGPCPGLADPMYGTECPWCEARAAIAKAKGI